MSRVCARIRPAEPADVATLATLIETVGTRTGVFSGRPLEPDAARLRARLGQIVADHERDVLVAVDEHSDELVGLLVAKPDDLGVIDPVPALHVTHLMVAPKFRRRGIGRLLLAAAVHLADERGIDRLLATVASHSREANRYLARIGFAPLVLNRVASTATLRRSLATVDADKIDVLRRVRLARAQRAGADARVSARVLGRGA